MAQLSQEASGELPAAAIEHALPASASQEELSRRAEQAVAGAERSAGPSQPPAVVTPTVNPFTQTIPLPSAAALQTDVSATTQSASPVADDDDNLIEKEWVNRARQIVERTRSDPYKQSEDLTLFKADYIKKRYGKAIKISQ